MARLLGSLHLAPLPLPPLGRVLLKLSLFGCLVTAAIALLARSMCGAQPKAFVGQPMGEVLGQAIPPRHVARVGEAPQLTMSVYNEDLGGGRNGPALKNQGLPPWTEGCVMIFGGGATEMVVYVDRHNRAARIFYGGT